MEKLRTTASAPAWIPPHHQREVDAIQAAIRSEADAQAGAGRRSLFKPPPPRPAPSNVLLDHRIAEEMEFIVRQLEHLGATLSNDSILIHRHAGELQSIDLMKQSLRHLAQVVGAEDKDLAADQISLTALKARLQRKALRPIGELKSIS